MLIDFKETFQREWKNLTFIVSISALASVFILLNKDPEVFADRIFWVNTSIASFFTVIYIIAILLGIKNDIKRAVARVFILVLFNTLIVCIYNWSVDHYNQDNGTKVEKKNMKNGFSLPVEE